MRKIIIQVLAVAMIGILGAAVWIALPKVDDQTSVQDKVKLVVGDEFAFQFTRHDNQLLQPRKLKESANQDASVAIKLVTTSQSAGPPPRVGAIRPFLSVTNSFEKPLLLRGQVRLNGHKDFVEIDGLEPVMPTETMYQCWDFDTTVDEVVLHDFKLVD